MTFGFDVDRERFISLVTFKRSGDEVATPVWFAADPDDEARLWVYTNTTSGKAKRVRANGKARIAPCTASGRVTGAFVEVRAREASRDGARDDFERGWRVLMRRYGWQMQAVVGFSRLGRAYGQRTVIELVGSADASAAS